MTRVVVLDSAALEALASRRGAGRATVRAALEAADRLGRDVVVPTLVLAEAYRDRRHGGAIDALLGREPGFVLRDTDRWFARLVGALLSAAGFGSEAMVDAHVVAAAVEAGGGLCLTGDPVDLERLAAGSPAVVIAGVV
jgi:predicted nucleic acid-binding protein